MRDIEMRLFEEIGTQLKGMTDAVKDLTQEMRDVRERLIRIEAQDQPQKIAALEADLRATQDHLARTEREHADAIAHAAQERARIEQHHAAALAAATATLTSVAAADKVALENRLTRMEVIIAPLTVGGSAFLAAVIGAIVTFVMGGVP